MAEPSTLLVWWFAALGVLVALTLPLGVYRAAMRAGYAWPRVRTLALGALAATGIWLAGTLAAAGAGLLRFDGRPPTMPILFVVIVLVAVLVARSWLGGLLAAHLPLAALVGVQSFRVPLELAMHRAYEEGVMPVQMSYSGLNFDIVTGVAATMLAFALVAVRVPLRLVYGWNVLGLALLLNVLAVAWLSAPTPLRVFMDEPANVWILRPPFVWLPAVLVLAALLGHLLIFRRLHGLRAAGVTHVGGRAARARPGVGAGAG